jgi:hypothetical protein
VRRVVLLALIPGLSACPDPLAGARRPDAGGALPDPRLDTRYVQVRNLLELDPDSPERAHKLYPLVAPVCASAQERADFVATAKWSVSFTQGDYQLPEVLAADTLEFTATTCLRTAPEAAFDLLDKAQAALPDLTRLWVIRARLEAARGRLEAAEAAAEQAVSQGSVHAIALAANIQARRAREAQVGYQAGMLDEAIATVSREPDNTWPVVDLAAVLSTRARLLSERALWQDGDAAAKSRLEAAGLYERLAGAPFIAAMRQRALDVLCSEAQLAGRDPTRACARLVAEAQDLGAAAAVGLDPAADPRLDAERRARLEQLAKDVAALPPKQVILLVARGDEAELLEWIRPAQAFLRRLQARRPRWVVVDRTDSERASALLTRLLAGAEVRPTLHIPARKDTLAMPCVSAVLADRRTPAACPLPAATVKALQGLRPFGLAVLVGRDLDAEIDDLRLYTLRTALLSFRQSRMDKGIDAWLKSLSDVGVVARPEGFGALPR